jgi:K+-transporting ATPase c subunit
MRQELDANASQLETDRAHLTSLLEQERSRSKASEMAAAEAHATFVTATAENYEQKTSELTVRMQEREADAVQFAVRMAEVRATEAEAKAEQRAIDADVVFRAQLEAQSAELQKERQGWQREIQQVLEEQVDTRTFDFFAIAL